ncbi:MAG: hypothetical protein H6548_11575 [Chitinophagales bacterium]|nr:hypothetical protein [Chitinophagales bacterium]HAE12920.1 hypothetical protein [Bacteroidota bacterium]MCB9020282.1 hypothetical protein [Chitinophagales bacterium]MCB9022749.1 hypothetical protein [Chitinophagales bacterium]HAE34391.1 hypothetical protein [Bacteroidota bacterium]
MQTKNLFLTGAALLLTLPLQFCTASKSATKTTEETTTTEPTVSYSRDLAPIMEAKCTPCHFPETGKKKLLNTYAAVSESSDYILFRIQLPEDDPEFMPFKGKKPALTPEEVQLFVQWAAEGKAE